MSNNKIVFIISIFLIILACMRIPWMVSFISDPNQQKANHGVLDLRSLDFDVDETLTLDGEWELHPGAFSLSNQPDASIDKNIVSVPSDWKNHFPEDANTTDFYGAYQLRILVPDEREKRQYRINLPHKPNISKLFVNNELLIDNKDVDKQVSGVFSRTASFMANDQNEIMITIHVPENSPARVKGFIKSIEFGNESSLSRKSFLSIIMQLTVAIITLLHFIYGCILFFWRRQHTEFLYFAIASFFATIVTLMDDDRLLLTLLPMDENWYVKILFISYIGIAVFMLLFVRKFFSEYKNSRAIRAVNYIYIFFVFLVILSPLQYMPLLVITIFVIIVLSFSMISIFIWRSLEGKSGDIFFLLLAATSCTSSFLWAFYKSYSLRELPYYPLDIIFAFLSISILLFNRFNRVNNQNEELAIMLRKEIKQKDDFLANTSHELRNPLHGMINIAQSVLQNKQTTLDEKSEKSIGLLVTIGHHMSQTFNDFLDVTLLKEHRIKLQKQQVDIQSLSSGVIDMLAFMVEEKNIQLKLQISNDFPKVIADKNRLIQILFNLLHNAVKFTQEGIITIDASVKGELANIHIIDTGIGMDDEIIHSIFNPYEQANSGITSIGGGLGLGLSICRQLVEMHGGTLKASSILGEGSVFTFSLPIAGDSFEQEFVEHPVQGIDAGVTSFKVDPIAINLAISEINKNQLFSHKPRILAVDDDSVNLKVLMNILSTDQYEIVTVTSAKEALSYLVKKEWDLVIADVMMPHMSGYELTRAIRKTFSISELPVLLLTARSQPEDIYTGFLAGANDYLTKPVDALELNVRVHALTNLKESISNQLQLEAAWLQAQIKPHFLFNTLNTIASLSEIDTDRMINLLHKFGQYLGKSFDSKNLDRIVPLKHELNLVDSYVYIEKERFGKRLQFKWETNVEKDFQIPPFSIQTLVENAIHHGILKRIEGGTVTVAIHVEEDYTQVSIIDDGVGMEDEKVKQILTAQADKDRGIGLSNTNQRLMQLYGEGLVVHSILGVGTTVSFKIPKI